MLLFAVVFMYSARGLAQNSSPYEDYLTRVRLASGMSEKSSPKRCFDVEEIRTENSSETVLMIYDYYCPQIDSCSEQCDRDHAVESFDSSVEVDLSNHEDYKVINIPYFHEFLFYSYVSGEWYLKKPYSSNSTFGKDYR